VNQKTALISYAQNGQFKLQHLSQAFSSLRSCASDNCGRIKKFPQKVVGNIAFTYTFQPAAADTSGTARIEAVLENPGIWQKDTVIGSGYRISGNFNALISQWTSRNSPRFSPQLRPKPTFPQLRRTLLFNAYFQSGSSVTVQKPPDNNRK